MEPKNLLALAMVYSCEERPVIGQLFRDRVRLAELEKLGYIVYSLDDKHDPKDGLVGRHCQAKFSNAHRLLSNIRNAWDSISFGCVIMDYFYCPNGWAKERWTANFFKDVLPLFATSGLVHEKGEIWLPYFSDVEEYISEFYATITEHYYIKLVRRVEKNPLYLATNMCNDRLSLAPNAYTNLTQMVPLRNYSTTPFCLLRCKSIDPEPVPKKLRMSRKIIVKAFLGARDSVQNPIFKSAFLSTRQCWAGFDVELLTLTTNELKILKWNPKQFVDWLLNDAEMFFLTNHPHQGMSFWDTFDLYKQLQRLSTKSGFPCGINLQCPIFLQDKYQYIHACPSLTIPTLKVEFCKKKTR